MKRLWKLVIFLVHVAFYRGAQSLNLALCRTVLGMQTGEIPDSALSASSSKDEDLGPASARIRHEKRGGAWCPKEEVSKNSFEYLQIDLGELKVITLIETQGHFGHGQGQEYTEQYMVEYQREEGASWFRYRNNRRQELFQGNANTYSAELRDVIPPVIAKRIRVIPYSTHPKHVCLRIELYGCTWTDGIVSYDMHQGEKRGTDTDLSDFTYDGTSKIYLSGGLGQLTDGDDGQSNFRLDQRSLRKRGYEWVGWKSDTFGDNPVEITFKFDAVRNFSLLQIYANNLFPKDVRVFRSAKVFFSLDGQQFMVVPPVEYFYKRDSVNELARPVSIPLLHRVGRYVKVWLFFDSKWMLISEVHFESERVTLNSSEEDYSQTSAACTSSSCINRTKNNSTVPVGANGDDDDNDNDGDDDDNDKSVILFVGNGGVLESARTTDLSKLNPDSDFDINDDFAVTSMSDVETADTRQQGGMFIAIIVFISVVLAIVPVALCVFIKHRKYTCMPLPYPSPKVTNPVVTSYSPTPPATLNKSSLPHDGSLQQEPIYDNIPSQDRWSSSFRGTNSTGSIRSTAETLSRLFVRDFNGVSCENVDPLIVTPDQVVLIERLGESRFGEVHLSEVQLSPRHDQDFESLNSRTNFKSQLVIVRWLRGSADEHTRADFSRESKRLLLVKHSNISQIIGFCSSESLFSSSGILMEAGEYGDLKTFLQQHTAEGGGATMRRDAKVLSYGTLVYIATQIASGMKQMETLNLVHRDLASRNCLVGPQFVIKVADLGRSYFKHKMDYCNIQGYAGLPIRWMAWEAVLLAKFSTKSDIWSFAVTLWEILTLGRRWPLESLSDRQVVENCSHYYLKDGLEQCLDQPGLCTREVYDLLLECCHYDESKRPSFKEIHMFLQRKNMGYRPDGERTTMS